MLASGVSELIHISIPSPHTGRDLILHGGIAKEPIPIPSPHTGRDRSIRCFVGGLSNSNPLSPYGERLAPSIDWGSDEKFQSPLPIRGETRLRKRLGLSELFQSPLPIRGETASADGLNQGG